MSIKKKVVSGFINPRWPKERVVKWLEIGAVPAILGLWFPDWLGSFGQGNFFYIPPLTPPIPPFLTYIGALILLKACYEGIKNMGLHFRGLLISGGICLLSAVLSVLSIFFNNPYISLLSIGSAAFFAAGFFWFTMGKVYEITQEKRTLAAWRSVCVLSVSALVTYIVGIVLYINNSAFSFVILRIAVFIITLAFFFCRYGVYCYKTQTSIGAKFKEKPDDQFWISAG
jgi:hypothetical protein